MNEKTRLLLVDDDPNNLNVLEDMLEDEYVLDLAYDGKEAIEKIANETYDLAVFDIMMPNMTGVEAVRHVREKLESDLPVVFLTAYGDAKNMHEAIKVSTRGFFLKPLAEQEDEFLALVRNITKSRKEEQSIHSLLSENTHLLELRIESDSNSIESTVSYLANIIAHKPAPLIDVAAFRLVLQEVLLNIQYYGCLGLSSESREEDIFDTIIVKSRKTNVTNGKRIRVVYSWEETSSMVRVLCEDPTENFTNWRNIIRFANIETYDAYIEGETFYRLSTIKPLFDDVFASHGRGFYIINLYANLLINEQGNRIAVEFPQSAK